MIRLVCDENLDDFLALSNDCSVTACKIHTLYQCYKNDADMAQFWIVYGASKPLGIMCLSADVLTVHAKLMLKKEFTEFLGFINWKTVECDCTGVFSSANELGAEVNNLSVQRFMYPPMECIEKRDIPEIKDEIKISELYDLLCEADSHFKDVSVFDAWMCSISYRVRHGYSKVYGIYEDDKLVSTAGVYTESDTCGVIESVATHPDYRMKGYACALTLQSVQLLMNDKKKALIVTSNMRNHEMYHKLGFRDCGTLFIMKNPNA